MLFINSVVRCCDVPLPPEAYTSLAGFFFAKSISSFTLDTGNDGFTISASGVEPASVSGAKSLAASYGSFG